MKKKNSHKNKKEPVNMYAWMQKHQKAFAGVICFILILGLVAGLMI